MNPGFTLGRAEEADVPALVGLESICFSHPWTAQNFQEAMVGPERGGVLVFRRPAEDDEGRGLLAYCVIQILVDEVHVHNLAVRPDERRRGLARRLLLLTLELAARRGARRAFLEVRASNEGARRLYQAMGFREVAVRRAYYVHPTEDALVLRLDHVGAARPETA